MTGNRRQLAVDLDAACVCVSRRVLLEHLVLAACFLLVKGSLLLKVCLLVQGVGNVGSASAPSRWESGMHTLVRECCAVTFAVSPFQSVCVCVCRRQTDSQTETAYIGVFLVARILFRPVICTFLGKR